MTIETVLKEYILTKYKSIREFCMQNDFPYSTIDNMLKRKSGIMGTSVTTVIKVCDSLNIDIEELSKGNITEKSLDTTVFSNHERTLVQAYRNNPELPKEKYTTLLSEPSIKLLVEEKICWRS